MKHKAHLGATTHKTVVIEQGLIQRFVDALDLGDPLSKDPEAARAAGLPGLVLPQSAAASLGDFAHFLTLLELRPKQVLHSREHVQVFVPVCAGDELTITYPLVGFKHAPAGLWKSKMQPPVDLTFDWIGNIIAGSSPAPSGTPLFTGKPRVLPPPPASAIVP